MSKLWIVVVILALAVGLWLFGRRNPESGNPPPTSSVGENQSAPPTANNLPATTTASPVAAVTPPLADLASRAGSPPPSPPVATEPPNLPALTVLDNARLAIHNYNERFGENPVGDNREITTALIGQNPKQINFINSESGLRVNANGELVDVQGTPFFFHQISGKEMEIRSAGQDRKMWTVDDLVTR